MGAAENAESVASREEEKKRFETAVLFYFMIYSGSYNLFCTDIILVPPSRLLLFWFFFVSLLGIFRHLVSANECCLAALLRYGSNAAVFESQHTEFRAAGHRQTSNQRVEKSDRDAGKRSEEFIQSRPDLVSYF